VLYSEQFGAPLALPPYISDSRDDAEDHSVAVLEIAVLKDYSLLRRIGAQSYSDMESAQRRYPRSQYHCKAIFWQSSIHHCNQHLNSERSLGQERIRKVFWLLLWHLIVMLGGVAATKD